MYDTEADTLIADKGGRPCDHLTDMSQGVAGLSVQPAPIPGCTVARGRTCRSVNLSVHATLPWCPAHGLAAHLAAMQRIVPRHCPFEKIPGKFFGGSHLEVAAR